jgi:hypothetical protein
LPPLGNQEETTFKLTSVIYGSTAAGKVKRKNIEISYCVVGFKISTKENLKAFQSSERKGEILRRIYWQDC